MKTDNLDKIIVKEQARIIGDLKQEIEALRTGSGGTLVNFSDVFNGQSDQPVINIDDFLSDNTTFNFRLNAALKKEFSEVCKRQHLTVGAALKRYMTDCVRSRNLK